MCPAVLVGTLSDMRTQWISGLLAVALLWPAVPADAAPSADCAAPAAAGAALDHFLSTTIPAAPGGAVVSVVSGDRTVFTKGYGSLDPDRSLIRIASITKLFTWTAVMQQVEAGRLDLNADVNDYLTTFKIPATYPQPITLLDLMNHTAGFEDVIIGTAARTAADVSPLGTYLAEHMPARIRPPGQVTAYSNYGAALAGYIVTQVSGQAWDAYVQQHLLDPLGMSHSTATEPVPAALAAGSTLSYNTDVKPVRTVPFQFDPLTPDGSISATAADLAHFMSAQLDDGRGILSPATTALMHERSSPSDPRLDGYAHGFMDRTVNGHRVLEHDGGWEGFGSLMVLVPDCHLGVFVSTNTTGGLAAMVHRITDLYATFLPVQAAPPVAGGPTVAPVAGFYKSTRRNESGMEKLLTLLSSYRLTVNGSVHFKGKEWVPVGDGLYRATDGSDHLVFQAGGRVATDGPAYQLMRPAETLPVNLVVLLVIAVLALTAIAVPLGRLRRRQRTRGWRLARSLAAGAAGLDLAFLGLLLLVLFGNTSDYIYGPPVAFRLLLVLPLVVLAAGAAALLGTVVSWRGSGAGVTARTHQVLLLAGLVAFAWFVAQWNLIGWQFT
jgi:CubicO group peptidase (beta-lactamase class C family)